MTTIIARDELAEAIDRTGVSRYADGIEDWTAAGLPTESNLPTGAA
ncbi:hypothetical protein [Myceligenerans indicum]|uniref:Rhodanese domain-containing protein n=1 Tax=Myceligenerans indicum TaxID=2593663 RepID=A0ABS1LHL9_9MICO|nr:hypothetical protein [Myceligenerans indicum]MBL0885732.1 hypothetical protein [Myceligenerans indicum]